MSKPVAADIFLDASIVRSLPLRERIGISIRAENVHDAAEKIKNASMGGFRQVWMTSSGSGFRDTLTLYAAVAGQIDNIRLGTSIVQIYTRHPVVTAQQVLAINDVASGRFRLGVGVSHRPIIEERYGISMQEPLSYIKEYVNLLKNLLSKGKVDFSGRHFRVNFSMQQTAMVPILMGALGPKSFELAGEISDGAISWMCPPSYLRTKAIEALKKGSRKGQRQQPPLIAEMMIAMSEDERKVLEAAMQNVHFYAQMPFYKNMFREAGYDLIDDKSKRELANSLTIWGKKEVVHDSIAHLLEDGIDELLLTHLVVDKQSEEIARLYEVINRL
ncbi:MAG: LLM class flavin-dependent oxidoreductase [Conexivisphaerales archaeon]